MAGFLIAVQMLLNGQLFEIVRFKNRLPGNSFGYRDLMMSLKLAGSEHVCELQLHLQSIIDIKPGPSRCESQHLKRNMRSMNINVAHAFVRLVFDAANPSSVFLTFA